MLIRFSFFVQLRYITPSQYEVIIHERHLNSYCSYPLCPNPPSEPFNSARRFKISTTNRSITEVQGNKDEGFCSKVCGVRSKWVKGQLDLAGSVFDRGKSWTVELTEEMGLDIEGRMKELGIVDRSRKDTRGVTPKSKPVQGEQRSPSTSTLASASALGALKSTPVERTPPSTSITASKVMVSAPPPPSKDITVPTDLLSGLRIPARPTPKKAVPPSLIPSSPPVPDPRQARTSTVTGTSSSPADNTPSIPIRRAPPTSILGEQSKLAQTVLKASKAINPEPQINPDSEDEAEHPELEWEKEVGLDWGGSGTVEGEEGDLWAMMKEAREMEGES